MRSSSSRSWLVDRGSTSAATAASASPSARLSAMHPLGLVHVTVAPELTDLLGELVDPATRVVALRGQLRGAARRGRRPGRAAPAAPGRPGGPSPRRHRPRSVRSRRTSITRRGYSAGRSVPTGDCPLTSAVVAAVEVQDLVVRYGDLVAVDHLSFTAEAGAVTAVLGPNGAGKTSTIEVLEGFRAPDRRCRAGARARSRPPSTARSWPRWA